MEILENKEICKKCGCDYSPVDLLSFKTTCKKITKDVCIYDLKNRPSVVLI